MARRRRRSPACAAISTSSRHSRVSCAASSIPIAVRPTMIATLASTRPDAMRGLIGHTGFVGSNLARQARFDATYNSANIDSIAGQEFDLLVIAGVRAEKWIANANPDQDRAGIERLLTP